MRRSFLVVFGASLLEIRAPPAHHRGIRKGGEKTGVSKASATSGLGRRARTLAEENGRITPLSVELSGAYNLMIRNSASRGLLRSRMECHDLLLKMWKSY